MYNCDFSAAELRGIRRHRYHHPDPVVRKRMTILWYKSQGLPHQEIAKLSDAAPNTVTATIRTYTEKGLTALVERNFHCPASQLDPYRSELAAYFAAHPPRTLKEAAAEIERLTGLSFTLPHVRNFLLSLGLSRKKLEAFQGRWMIRSEKSKNHLFAIS
jgi:transposase